MKPRFAILPLGVSARDQRSALLVVQETSATATMRGEVAVQRFDDPDGRKDGESESRPVNKVGRGLLMVNGKQRPGDGDGASNVTFGRRERVGCGGRLKGQECEEHEDFGEDTSLMGASINTECLKGGQENEDSGPTMVEREGQVDPELVV